MDNNHNMPGQQNDKQEEQEYSLYTEKIVRKPGSRIKRAVKQIAKVVGSAVLFGVVSGLVLSVVYPTAKKFVGDAEPTTRQGTVIPTDSQTEEPAGDSWAYSDTETGEPESSAAVQNESNYNAGGSGSEGISGENGGNAMENTSENADNQVIGREELESLVNDRIDHAFTMYKPGMSELDSLYSGLRTVINDVNKSIVSVEVSYDGVNWDYISDTGIMGFIAADDDEYFYILTIKEFVEEKYLSVIFNDGTVAQGTYITGDMTTNQAIVAVDKSVFGGKVPENVKTAVLGNSYVVQQGDKVMAIGNIYGQSDMVVYTTATSVKKSVVDTDCSYRVISTDILSGDADSGIIVNTKGEIVGIIPYHNEAISGEIINSYGISELKRLIERLINGKVTPYMGVIPQTVTSVMKDVYGMPDGVYVNLVERDSPAFYAGIQSGDIITYIGKESVMTSRALQNILFMTDAGTELTVYISRPGKDGYRNIEITLVLGSE